MSTGVSRRGRSGGGVEALAGEIGVTGRMVARRRRSGAHVTSLGWGLRCEWPGRLAPVPPAHASAFAITRTMEERGGRGMGQVQGSGPDAPR